MINSYCNSLFFRKPIMETVDASTKMKCLIDKALKGQLSWPALDSLINRLIYLAMKQEVSWTVLASVLDEVSTTLVKSKQVIKILVKNLEGMIKITDSTAKEARKGTETFDQYNSLNEVVFQDASLKNCDSEDFRLVEQYKDQLYTFVGDNFEGKSGRDNWNKSNVLNKFESNDKPVDSKATKEKAKKNPYLCNTCNKTFVSMVI